MDAEEIKLLIQTNYPKGFYQRDRSPEECRFFSVAHKTSPFPLLNFISMKSDGKAWLISTFLSVGKIYSTQFFNSEADAIAFMNAIGIYDIVIEEQKKEYVQIDELASLQQSLDAAADVAQWLLLHKDKIDLVEEEQHATKVYFHSTPIRQVIARFQGHLDGETTILLFADMNYHIYWNDR